MITAAASKYTGTVSIMLRIAGGKMPGSSIATTLYVHATPTPSAIKVNMLRLRLTTDAQPSRKIGQPPHSTAGVANPNSIHCSITIETNSGIACGARSETIASRHTGKASAALTQKRRLMSFNSALSSAEALRGSSAMPQIGQLPGSVRTICGCIGQVYSVTFDLAGMGFTGSKAMPHFGHEPGVAWRTSGCMGQV